jgi:hypothetical protein
MQETATRLAESLRRINGESSPVTAARIVSLSQIAVGLDAAPGSAALWSQWLGLLRDLQRGQDDDDGARTELAAVMAEVQPRNGR